MASCFVSQRIWFLVVLLAVAGEARAANVFWRNPSGGSFQSAGSWFGSVVPGGNDYAHFSLTTDPNQVPNPYTASFSASPTNLGMVVEDDLVTFDLNSNVYTTTQFDAVTIATTGSARLTITDGILSVPFQSEFAVGAAANRTGTLNVSTGGLIIGDPSLEIGVVGSGNMTISNNGDVVTDRTHIGFNAGVNGIATVTGAGSSLSALEIFVGSSGIGTLNINSSGRVDVANDAWVGNLAGSTGTANVAGANSLWDISGGLSVGNDGTGTLTVTNGGRVEAASAVFGRLVGRTGTALVDGPGTKLDISGSLAIGSAGTGFLSVTGGGTVQSGSVLIAHRDISGNPGTGAATVSGLNSQWIISGKLAVGINGVGTLDVSGGGLVQSTSGEIGALGAGTDGSGIVHVTDATSRWINSGELFVGATHTGTLFITGGQVQNSNGVIGGYDFVGPGAVIVDGADSEWINLGDATIGRHSVGTLDITGGGRVDSVNGYIGREQHGKGRVTVNGSAGVASWINSGQVTVGYLGDSAVLEIKNGGQVQSNSGAVGSPITSVASVLVDGSNSEGFDSQWVMSGNLRIWSDSSTLTITNGGRVENADGIYGELVTVSGPNSRWINLGDVRTDGGGSLGEIRVNNGGRVESVNGSVSGKVSVTGPGSRWINSGTLGVGDVSPGTLNITQGGVVQNVNASIASAVNTSGTVNVDGNGSQWINFGNLTVGAFQNGFLNITGGGRVQSVDGTVGIGNPAQSARVTVAGAGSQWTMSGSLRLKRGELAILPGGSVVVTHVTTLDTSGQLKLEGGTFSTSEIIDVDGQFSWTSGTLHVGKYHDDLTVPNGGTLAPVDLTSINGDYVQQSGGALEIDTGFITERVSISGAASLGGNLVVKLRSGEFPAFNQLTYCLEAQSVTGAFANVANGQRILTADGRGSFIVNYGPTSPFNRSLVVLSNFITNLPGDFNNNGTVDAADYVVWRKNLGGIYTTADYNTWRTHFGQSFAFANGSTSSPTANIPEPATIVLSLIVMAGLRFQRGRAAKRVPPVRQCAAVTY